jgi:hypothetical protein
LLDPPPPPQLNKGIGGVVMNTERKKHATDQVITAIDRGIELLDVPSASVPSSKPVVALPT